MKSLVRVEVADRPAAPLVPPPQQYFLRENLRLRLLTARIALLSHDDAGFKTDVTAANAWLKQYFDTRTKTGAGARPPTLTQLAATPMPAELPDLAASLTALRSVKATRERSAGRRRHGAPLAAPMRLLFAFLLLAALAVLVGAAVQAQRGLCAVRRAAVPRRDLAQRVHPVAGRRLSSCCILLLRLAGADRAACRRRCARAAAAATSSARAASRMPRVVALLEGRYGKARQFAEEALAIPHSTGLPALLGCAGRRRHARVRPGRDVARRVRTPACRASPCRGSCSKRTWRWSRASRARRWPSSPS